MSDRPPLLLYCQHSLGLGHLKRSWALAEALSRSFTPFLASGGAAPRDLQPPAGITTIELPPVAENHEGRLVPVEDGEPIERVMDARRQRLLDAVTTLRPRAIVVELFPFGRRKFRGELMPLLEAARHQPGVLVASSVRDLLVDRGSEQQRHDDRAAAILNEYFDAILVHTDPSFATLADTFHPSVPLRVPVLHTGFVVSPAPADTPPRGRRILVSGGGGRFAERLFQSAVAAHALLGDDAPPMLVVAGPLCTADVLDRLRAAAAHSERIAIVPTVADLSWEMRASAVSVSQCGYNTALDIVRAGVPALVVPFDDNGDSEQGDRAQRLARLGAVQVLPAAALEPAALADAIRQTLRFVPASPDFDLDGAAHSTRALVTMLRHADQRVLA
jgi:predicted glycosyltransferase